MATLRTIGVRLRLLTGDYKRDTDDAGKSTDQLSEKIHKAGAKSKADLDKIATGAGVAGAALLAAAGAAVHAAATFDKQMSEVGAVANANADELNQLRDAAIEAGQATVFSATDAAEAEAELAKAGVSTADILGGALTGSLDLASAGQLDLADSATIAAAAMNTFGLKGSDVSHVADVLAAAANKSAAGVDDLGLGLQQVGLVANQAGFSFEETVALLAAMADRGLKGSDGATSLKTALQRLAAPTDQAADTLKALGISLYDSNGNMVDAVTIAGQLEQGLKDLTPAQRNAALQTIFGSDAIRAANVLYSEGAAGIQDYIDAVDDQGAASRVAAAKLDNLSGDVEQLTGSLETLFIKSGEGANSGLRTLVHAGTDLVNMFGNLPGPVQTAAVVVAGAGGATLLAAAAGLKLKKTLGEIVDELSKTGPAGAKAAHGLEAVATWAGRAGLALTAVGVGGRLISSLGSEVNPQVTQLADNLADFGKSGNAASEAARLFGGDMEDLKYDLGTLGSGFWDQVGQGFASIMEAIGGEGPGSQNLAKAKDRITAIDQALAELVQSGRADEAARAFDQLAHYGSDVGISLDDLKAGLPAYAAAQSQAAHSADSQAQATKKLAEQTMALARATGFAVDEGETLVDLWDRMHGTVKSADEAMLDAKRAVDEVAEAFNKNGQALQGNTEKALENRIALENAARQAASAAETYLAMTGDVEGAKKIMHDFQEAAEKATGATGKAKQEVHNLANELFNLPQAKDITVTLHVTGNLNQKLGHLDFDAGGIVEHAQAGLLSQAAVFRTRQPAVYAFAEPSTMGEAFVPKRGNYGRSMSILSAAAGWYNADVVPRDGWYGGGWGGAGAGSLELVITAAPGSDAKVMSAITEGLRFDVRTKSGGNVQTHLGPRGRR